MNKVIKRTIAGIVGLGAVGGATAVAVSCGASQRVYPFKIYTYTFTSSPIDYSKNDKSLRLWVPFKNDVANVYYPLLKAVKELLEKNQYSVTVVDGATGGVDYAGAAAIYDNLARSENMLLPDVMINYPDLQALLVENDLAQPFDLATARSRITQALHFDITSPLSPKEEAYALPVSKSTELTYFNVPAFAMVLNEIALQKGTTDKIKFPNDSAQARMAKMIKNASTTNSNLHQDIYKAPVVEVEYNWSDFKDYWTNLTKTGGIWEKDAELLRKNFTLADKTKLLDFDLTNRLFETYTGLADYTKALGKAYTFETSGHDRAILGVDSATNTIYAYQYDAAGHTQDNFIIGADKKSSPPKLTFDYRDVITTGTGDTAVSTPSPTYQAFNYLSDLQASNSIYVRNQKSGIYTTVLMQKHQLFLAWQSSSGVSAAAAEDAKKELLNNGEIYFDYQPVKAGIAGETDKNTVINQGPSIFVSKVHSTESAKIAGLIVDEFKTGGVFASKIDASGKDTGIFSQAGYIYADADDYKAGSSYLQSLRTSVVSSANWSTTIGKYLLSEHYSKSADATTASKYDAFANPAGKITSSARNQIENAYLVANVNNAQVSAASAMQSVLRSIVSEFRLS